MNISEFSASSAGTHALISHPIVRNAALTLEKLGGDPSGFAARRLTSRLASEADLILAMTKAHRDAVLELSPRLLSRVFTLSEAARLSSENAARSVADLAAFRPHLLAEELVDIPDPIGQSTDYFDKVGAQIADLIEPIMELCRHN